ncbi:MAG: hypothetical protein ACOC44_11615 [Promethearchaeia archaeon]
MRKKKDSQKMKTDEWNERSRNREEKQTKREDDDWNKKEDEERERGEYRNEFHEEVYDT